MTDEEIDTSDVPLLDDGFFERASLRIPERQITVALRVDSDPATPPRVIENRSG